MEIPEILRALDAQIAQLQQARQLLSDASTTASPSLDSPKRRGRPPVAARETAKPAGKRTMSDEGKARIVAAQKKRWAKSKKAAKAAATPAIAKKTPAPAKTAEGKNAGSSVKSAAPAKAVPKKVAVPAKKSSAKKASLPKKHPAAAKAPQVVDSVEPVNTTAPIVPGEETAAEA